MTLTNLIEFAADKKQFANLNNYVAFCARFLDFIESGLQARIVSQNESHYQFFQYRKDGGFNVSRPLNTLLMLDAENFADASQKFLVILKNLRDIPNPSEDIRQNIIRVIYTLQQSIGATLDALPAGKSNQARKVNGDLFERLIRLIISLPGVECVAGTMQVPVRDANGVELLKSSYQHDLLISQNAELKIIGSVKTSSKDRLDKIFMDKFLYCKLTDTTLPHIAIFLNDIQRKKVKQENKFGVNSTFLPGHFKAYTIKLNPLDGVYYCDIRPNMMDDIFLAQRIKTIDRFFFEDLWLFLTRSGQHLSEIEVEKK